MASQAHSRLLVMMSGSGRPVTAQGSLCPVPPRFQNLLSAKMLAQVYRPDRQRFWNLLAGNCFSRAPGSWQERRTGYNPAAC